MFNHLSAIFRFHVDPYFAGLKPPSMGAVYVGRSTTERLDVTMICPGTLRKLLCWLTRRRSIIWEVLKWLQPNSP